MRFRARCARRHGGGAIRYRDAYIPVVGGDTVEFALQVTNHSRPAIFGSFRGIGLVIGLRSLILRCGIARAIRRIRPIRRALRRARRRLLGDARLGSRLLLALPARAKTQRPRHK